MCSTCFKYQLLYIHNMCHSQSFSFSWIFKMIGWKKVYFVIIAFVYIDLIRRSIGNQQEEAERSNEFKCIFVVTSKKHNQWIN